MPSLGALFEKHLYHFPYQISETIGNEQAGTEGLRRPNYLKKKGFVTNG